MTKTFTHDPDAVLDYVFDWNTTESGKRPWLDDTETITSFTVTVTPTDGITVDSSTEDSGVVTVWVSSAAGRFPRVTCHITTSAGRQDDRTIRFAVLER